ncbi:MAG: M14 family metallocarboxypeptidase [Bacillota bacterium]|nr:M14 family metallocarboxypeptidase [Bacillota bacterium]
MRSSNMNDMYDSKWLERAIANLQNLFPFITVNSIGSSILGKPIHEIKVGQGSRKIHMNASFHANEWITTVTLMNHLYKYLYSLSTGTLIRELNPHSIYKNTELSIVPMVNPDGVDLFFHGPPIELADEFFNMNIDKTDYIHWKANIRGIDLNKQFPANWNILKNNVPKFPGPRDYPGSSPLTEPESMAMADLARNCSFDFLFAFHTQGEEFYWGYEGFEPQESVEMAKRLEMASGYRAVQYVDSHGGFKDWFIQEFKRPAFTIELGRGINPLPMSQFNEILIKSEGIFFTALTF